MARTLNCTSGPTHIGMHLQKGTPLRPMLHLSQKKYEAPEAE